MDADNPQQLIELGLGFWRAQLLLTAVELDLFTALAAGPKSAAQLGSELGLHPRGVRDFLDALVALGLLARSADAYTNSAISARYLDRTTPEYLGGLFEMAGARLYPVWGKLSEALRSGLPQNEAKSEPDYYANLCDHEQRLRTFLRGMTGLSMLASQAIAERFPWAGYESFADIGGAHGLLATSILQKQPHLTGLSFDLPAVEPFFREHVESCGLQGRLRFHAGDFFSDPLPSADVLIFGHVLHNWDLEQKRLLIKKAHAALPAGGSLIVYEALIDDERRNNAFGLLMSLNMLLVTSGGFVFTGADCQGWMHEAGFSQARVEHLQGPDWMVVGTK